MKTLIVAAAVLLGSLLSLAAHADFVYEPFDYPAYYTRGEPLLQKSGGTGFASGWQSGAPEASTSNYNTFPGSLTYGNLVASGNLVVSAPTYGSVNGIVRQTVQSFMGDGVGTRFLSFLIQRNSTLGDFGGFGGLIIDGTVGDLFLGKGGNFGTWGMETRRGFDAVNSSVPATVGQTALLVLKMESYALGSDRFTLYVNPTPGQGEPSSTLVKTDLDVGTANTIGLYNSGAFTFDEIRIGDSFEAVTPTITSTPEPSTILLGALGLSPLLASRMRKRYSIATSKLTRRVAKVPDVGCF